MDDEKTRISSDIHVDKRNGRPATSNPACNLFLEVPRRVQSFLKVVPFIPFNTVIFWCLICRYLSSSSQTRCKGLIKNEAKTDTASFFQSKEKESYSALEVNLEKQLDAWRKNPTWIDEPPEIKVQKIEGSLTLVLK